MIFQACSFKMQQLKVSDTWTMHYKIRGGARCQGPAPQIKSEHVGVLGASFWEEHLVMEE